MAQDLLYITLEYMPCDCSHRKLKYRFTDNWKTKKQNHIGWWEELANNIHRGGENFQKCAEVGMSKNVIIMP